MKKLLIAITPVRRPGPADYPKPTTVHSSVNWNQDLIREYGAIPLMPDFVTEVDAEDVMSVCDGLFLTGGADVDPARYGEETQPYCATTQPERDASDLALLKAAIKLGKPVLAICRGFQIANVYFGGTLYQDISTQTGTDIKHSDYDPEHFSGFGESDSAHIVNVVKGSPLNKITGADTLYTNSLHHQGIKDLGKGLVSQATAPDGIIESWYLDSDTQYIRAYQWHPEFMYKHPAKDAIAEDFLKACRNKAK